MNVELLDTDATGCSVSGNNCGGERSSFWSNEHNSAAVDVSVFWHSSVDSSVGSAIPAAQSEFDSDSRF